MEDLFTMFSRRFVVISKKNRMNPKLKSPFILFPRFCGKFTPYTTRVSVHNNEAKYTRGSLQSSAAAPSMFVADNGTGDEINILRFMRMTSNENDVPCTVEIIERA